MDCPISNTVDPKEIVDLPIPPVEQESIKDDTIQEVQKQNNTPKTRPPRTEAQERQWQLTVKRRREECEKRKKAKENQEKAVITAVVVPTTEEKKPESEEEHDSDWEEYQQYRRFLQRRKTPSKKENKKVRVESPRKLASVSSVSSDEESPVPVQAAPPKTYSRALPPPLYSFASSHSRKPW